jgi:hypothetical protein
LDVSVRPILAVAMVVFIAAVFAVAYMTTGEGGLFLASVVSAAGVLIALVVVVALPAKPRMREDSPQDDFAMFEEAARHAVRGGLVNESPGTDLKTLLPDREDESSRESARAFVKALVPAPRPPPALASAVARGEFLDALRKEARGLIRLSRVTMTDIAPYKAILADARKAALRGDGQATIRSLQLANELLRATIEKHLVKRRSQGHREREFPEL